MTFDPFGDFDSAGYLRNFFKEKNVEVLKSLEHGVFLKEAPSLMDWLSIQDNLTYDVFLETHRRIFSDVYPWAGQDRMALTPDRVVRKGSTVFASPEEIHTVFVQAMQQATPGRVLGGLALAHPFLDGNGRAIVPFFSEVQRRCHILVRWDKIEKMPYLTALSKAIDGYPGDLDRILQKNSVRFPVQPPSPERLSRQLASIDWGNQSLVVNYKEKPTFLAKMFRKTLS